MKDLYKILGVENEANMAEVKRAYFELAKKYHPDSGNEDEVRKFYEIAEAYEILSDEKQRKAYDLTLESGKIEKPLVVNSYGDSVGQSKKDPDYEFRQKEVHKFRRGLLYQAYMRVVFLTILLAGAGYFYALIFRGLPWLGLIFGGLFGLAVSLYRNFDVSSYSKNKKQETLYETLHFFVIGVSVIYFLAILLMK